MCRFLTFAVLSLLASAHAAEIPTQITIADKGLYPEGIAYDGKRDAFWISSFQYGRLSLIGSTGGIRDTISHPELISSIGMKLRGGELYVCVGDLGVSKHSITEGIRKIAKVLVFHTGTRKLIRVHDLSPVAGSGPLFPNDLDIDPAGNIYVTDSFSPQIYKITPQGEASILITSDLFKGAEGANLNGILWHPDGYLLASKQNNGRLFKIDAVKKTVAEVRLPAPIPGADGIVLGPDRSLHVAINPKGGSRVARYTSQDGWSTAQLASEDKTGYRFPTTATLANGKVFTLNGDLRPLFEKQPDVETFTIREYQPQ
ncbi:MAG: SMP-30/gluconolactonase/LRE family protein [Verrucomicrobiota bacterium]